VALLGLNTRDWAAAHPRPLAGLISASGLLVRGWVCYPLATADQYSWIILNNSFELMWFRVRLVA